MRKKRVVRIGPGVVRIGPWLVQIGPFVVFYSSAHSRNPVEDSENPSEGKMCPIDQAFRSRRVFENRLMCCNSRAHKPLLGPNWTSSPYVFHSIHLFSFIEFPHK